MDVFESTGFWGVIGIIVTYIFYRLGKSDKDERSHLLLMFYSTQTSNKKLREKLNQFISEFDASDIIMFPDKQLTYGAYLNILAEDYEKSLSDKKIDFIKNEKRLTKPTLISMTESVTRQFNELSGVDAELDLVINRLRASKK